MVKGTNFKVGVSRKMTDLNIVRLRFNPRRRSQTAIKAGRTIVQAIFGIIVEDLDRIMGSLIRKAIPLECMSTLWVENCSSRKTGKSSGWHMTQRNF